jgi:hypothetical protein
MAEDGADALRALLEDNDALLHAANMQGMTALHWAAGVGRCEAVQVLLDLGANAHAPTKTGATALTLAASGGHSDVVQRLEQCVLCSIFVFVYRTGRSRRRRGAITCPALHPGCRHVRGLDLRSSWEVEHAQLQGLQRELGSGGFGVVRRSTLNGADVAVKQLKAKTGVVARLRRVRRRVAWRVCRSILLLI